MGSFSWKFKQFDLETEFHLRLCITETPRSGTEEQESLHLYELRSNITATRQSGYGLQ